MATKMELKFDEAMKTIDILTNRLIDLANLENKLIEREQRFSKKLAECHAIHMSVIKLEEIMKNYADITQRHIDINKQFFSFRFKWMERLIHKRRTWL